MSSSLQTFIIHLFNTKQQLDNLENGVRPQILPSQIRSRISKYYKVYMSTCTEIIRASLTGGGPHTFLRTPPPRGAKGENYKRKQP